VDEHKPHAVISLGEAGGRARISIERAAVNLLDFRMADNAGAQVHDQPVVEGGPAAYFSTLPVRQMYEMLLEKGIPTELSLSAGAFICNQVMYTCLHHIERSGRRVPAGFIHLPYLPEQAAALARAGKAAAPSMALETLVAAVRASIEVVAEYVGREADLLVDG
jgi:pyroglutamyl-peptidase